MEDNKIIEEFWRRDEHAIECASRKYGSFCMRIACNILRSAEDAEECVNDAYIRAWNSIPPDSTIDESDRDRIVSVDSIELYDLSLYPIPRAESVPDELWEMVNAPIFAAEEITLDAVSARAEYFDEPGDEGVRVSFSVLFGDILMDISSKGLSAEEIYDIIIQVEKNI